MTRIAQSSLQAELSRKSEGIISINLLYELYPWLRISINMFSVKEGCVGFCFKFPPPFLLVPSRDLTVTFRLFRLLG